MSNLTGKVAVITGASSGIGEALAYDLAHKGCKLVLIARSVDKLKAVEDKCKAIGVDAISVKADVSVETDCKAAMEEAVKAFGGIDILINNAGISMRALFNDADVDVIRKVMDINFWGTVYSTKYALPHLLKSKGSVTGVSSIAGYKGLPGRTGYSASKFAMQGFLEALRCENLKKDLHVLIACPGFTASNIRNTALNEKGSTQGESPREEQKMMQPEEVAAAITKAIAKRRNTIVLTLNGKLTVNLNKFFPDWVTKLVYNHMAKEPDSPFK